MKDGDVLCAEISSCIGGGGGHSGEHEFGDPKRERLHKNLGDRAFAEISGGMEGSPPVLVSRRITRCPLSWMSFFKKAASEPFVSKVDRMMMVFCSNFIPPLGSYILI